jgi:transposase
VPVSGLFWLSDVQWAAIAPHLPMVHTGPRRVDDRRVISGILHRYREGCRWRSLPPAYGPYTTVFNRWNRWSQRGLWPQLFAALAACAEPPEVALIDSTAVKAHRAAAGAKKGHPGVPRTKPSAARAAGAAASCTRSVTLRAARAPSS